MRLSRHAMYQHIFNSVSLPLHGRILGISGLKYFTGSTNLKLDREVIASDAEIIEADFPEVSMTQLPYADNSFDVVISDQVIEHIEGDVQTAIEETRRVLKPGGIAIHTSVCMQPIHWGPKDMWRFTPDGLRYLTRAFSQTISCGSWGNKWVHILFLLYERSRDWNVPNQPYHPLHKLADFNDPKYPLMVWIIVKK